LNRLHRLTHEFVEYIPKTIPDGVLYISIAYTTAIHNCCCGCGSRVVTPLSPVDWTLIFDGRSVSLNPSIGNWDFPCQSHYYIKKGEVRWTRKFTRREIEGVKRKDQFDQVAYFGEPETRAEPIDEARKKADQPSAARDHGIWKTFGRLFRKDHEG
jgi:hypothetical protein